MIGILLVNLGTPDEPTTPAVRRYLKEFLMDPRVIDIDGFSRWILVNLLILPTRSKKSAAAYQKIWTKRGSPLRFNTEDLGQALQAKLGDSEFAVKVAMRYGHPSIRSALEAFTAMKVDSIRVLPLYPQYASSSTESTQDEVLKQSRLIEACPPVQFLLPFFDHPGYVKGFAEIGQPLLESFRPDHILFSFHGLPERQILKGDIGGNYCLKRPDCCAEIVPANGLCYRAHCFRSAQAIAEQLGLAPEKFTVCFQSRLGRTPWIQPFTDILLDELVQQGKLRIAVFCPSFVADCLETLEEIGIRGRNQVWSQGGELLMIPSLNSNPTWVNALAEMFRGI